MVAARVVAGAVAAREAPLQTPGVKAAPAARAVAMVGLAPAPLMGGAAATLPDRTGGAVSEQNQSFALKSGASYSVPATGKAGRTATEELAGAAAEVAAATPAESAVLEILPVAAAAATTAPLGRYAAPVVWRRTRRLLDRVVVPERVVVRAVVERITLLGQDLARHPRLWVELHAAMDKHKASAPFLGEEEGEVGFATVAMAGRVPGAPASIGPL